MAGEGTLGGGGVVGVASSSSAATAGALAAGADGVEEVVDVRSSSSRAIAEEERQAAVEEVVPRAEAYRAEVVKVAFPAELEVGGDAVPLRGIDARAEAVEVEGGEAVAMNRVGSVLGVPGHSYRICFSKESRRHQVSNHHILFLCLKARNHQLL